MVPMLRCAASGDAMFMIALLMVPLASASETFEGQGFYLGDLHAHTGASGDAASTDVGTKCADCGAVAELETLVDEAGLDFVGFTDHVNGKMAADPEDHATMMAAALALHDPDAGRVVIPSAEVWFYDSGGAGLGHKNMFLFEGDDSSLDMTVFQYDGTSQAVGSCAEIWDFAEAASKTYGALLLIPHHPGMANPMGTDWTCHADPRASTYAPVVEVYSEHGSSMGRAEWDDYDIIWKDPRAERMVPEVLSRTGFDLQMGFVGGTDSHDTRPGSVCDIDAYQPQHPYGGGLTVAVIDASTDFDRPAIYDAIAARSVYTTTGPLLPARVDFSAGGELLGGMGEDFTLPAKAALDIEIRVPEEDDPLLSEVFVVGPNDTSWPATSIGGGVWTVSIDGSEVPHYLFATVEFDRDTWYGEGVCEDGDASAKDGGSPQEYLWLSPSFIDTSAWDDDGDGWTPTDGDCDDADSAVSPAATEICDNSTDDDCNGRVDEADPACQEGTDTGGTTGTTGTTATTGTTGTTGTTRTTGTPGPPSNSFWTTGGTTGTTSGQPDSGTSGGSAGTRCATGAGAASGLWWLALLTTCARRRA